MVIKHCSRIFRIIVMSLLVAGPVLAQEVKVVEADGQVSLGDDSTIGQAKAAALNNARRAALEKATGVSVRGVSVVYNFQVISDLVQAATRGVIIEEKVLDQKCDVEDNHFFCTARIRAGVKPLNLEKRGKFSVTKVAVQRPDATKAAKSPVFQSKDEIQVRATVNEDAYLNVFSVDQNGGISRLYPNSLCEFEHVTAGKEFVFPDENQRKNGLKLRVITPKGVQKSIESVLVIATREKASFLDNKEIENPTITDLMKELSELESVTWVDKTEGYEVRE